MGQFHAYTRFGKPGLHVWREGTGLVLNLHPTSPGGGPGWVTFEYDMEPQITHETRFMLFEFTEQGAPGDYEKDEHQRVLPRQDDGTYPAAVWFAQGANRVLLSDPMQGGLDHLTVHLISQSRYRPSQLYRWDAASGASRRVDQAGLDAVGPYFELDLHGQDRSFFLFKFIRRGDEGQFSAFEPDFANRLWASTDGGEVWTHSEAAEVAPLLPQKRALRVHFRQELSETPRMRVWQDNSDYEVDVDGTPDGPGWTVFSTDVYTGIGYGFQFWNPGRPESSRWEHPEARRMGVRIRAETDFWTLEGDRTLFSADPSRDRTLELQVALKPPFSSLGDHLFAHVWVNLARAPIGPDAPVGGDGRVTVTTYPEVVTSVKFHDDAGHWEGIDRHPIRIATGEPDPTRYVVLERPPLLEEAPPADQFQDPPFTIRRPGAYQEGDALHFVVHAPNAARARLIGEWTGWLAHPVPMHSTRDGTYWWARVPVQDVLNGLGGGATDYHGRKYQFLFNDRERYQDPAAGWVEDSWNQAGSRLVWSDRFTWHDESWHRPGWEYLIIYQIHASRFTNRHQGDAPLRRVAKEIDAAGGYLRELGVTAIQLMPVNEVGTENSWGYDPAFFYAVENEFGGPDALKELVDACHHNGFAVLIDVVFNHAGNIDNILWEVARGSFFDGDTAWGAMINFDHPQVRHFFAQNLVYLAREYHIDGFRLDHTATIIHSAAWDPWSGYVRTLGSGGGWEFLHAIRHAIVTEVDPRCVLIAEHLPNEWSVTNYGGPMDSQWCDDFHDRMVDACRRQFGMSRLADALKLSQTACDNWYKVTNYPESHDEVGNVRDRVSYVAGWGQGLRMSKVAAAGSLLSRGIPMYFMGAESGEDRQFAFGSSEALDLDFYQSDPDRSRIRAWWREVAYLHRNPSIQGPSPIDVAFAEQQTLAFTRGARGDYFVLLNFGGWSGRINLGVLNLPWGTYRELWNSTWPAFAIASEGEGEHTNGGRDARLNRSQDLNIPDYGAVVLERVD
jgi:1,4-alpha-glucan branching enzyme